MGFLDKLFGRKKKEEEKPKAEEKIEKEEAPIEIEEDVIDLGWYWSERKQEWQMAKIREADRRTHFYVVGASGTGKSSCFD